jgi:hypothetical protein
MALGAGGSQGGKTLPQTTVGATLIGASIVVLVVGLGWLNHSGGGDRTDLAAPLARRSADAAGKSGKASEIPPSQPAVPVSFGAGGELIRPAPDTARIIDPTTGLEVVVTLPPGATVVDGQVVPAGSGDTAPTTGSTNGGGTVTTGPAAGSTSTTAGGTTSTTVDTTTTTAATTTTVETTTTTVDTTTTTEDTTTTDTTQPAPGGLLGSVVDAVGGLLNP